MKRLIWPILLLCVLLANSCTATQPEPTKGIEPATSVPATVSVTPSRSCQPTSDDGVSPSYQPNAPERSVVGSGHVVTGVVLSSRGCQPIPHARLEFWPEEEGLGHPDSSRATFYADQNGRYRLESNPPEHIHMRISADGHRTIGVNSYHPNGHAEGILDIVLQPE